MTKKEFSWNWHLDECLSRPCQVRQELTQVGHLSGAPIHGRFPTFPCKCYNNSAPKKPVLEDLHLDGCQPPWLQTLLCKGTPDRKGSSVKKRTPPRSAEPKVINTFRVSFMLCRNKLEPLYCVTDQWWQPMELISTDWVLLQTRIKYTWYFNLLLTKHEQPKCFYNKRPCCECYKTFFFVTDAQEI